MSKATELLDSFGYPICTVDSYVKKAHPECAAAAREHGGKWVIWDDMNPDRIIAMGNNREKLAIDTLTALRKKGEINYTGEIF